MKITAMCIHCHTLLEQDWDEFKKAYEQSAKLAADLGKKGVSITCDDCAKIYPTETRATP